MVGLLAPFISVLTLAGSVFGDSSPLLAERSSFPAGGISSLWPSISPEAVAALSLLVKPVPNTGANTALITKTFVVPHTNGADDAVAVNAAIASKNYTTNARFLFQSGVNYNIWTPITWTSLSNVEIVFEGNLNLPQNISAIQAIVGASGFSGYWFKVTGSSVTVRGNLNPSWGWINCYGSPWWDANQQTNRPHLFSYPTANSTLHNLKVKDSIAWNFALSSGTNIHAYGNLIDTQQRKGGGFPFNTDGFGAGGTNILIEENVIMNGDDCLTVGNGANGIHFRNAYCQGGHGLSIVCGQVFFMARHSYCALKGSLGSGGSTASVHNVLIENVAMVNELYGARFKSWTGGKGLAQNVTWKNIYVQNVPFPIYVTQNYWDQNLGPKPNSSSTTNTAIDSFTWENFYGTQENVPFVEGSCVTDPCWYYVANATGREIIILDLYPNTATNLTTSNIQVRPETGAIPAVMCNATTVSSSPHLGFKCWDGPYVVEK
ncbi:pectin lyase-like protein [Clavulina sp. PMI_390]|nr:pectin lyase-like protein [Clavulina sp. PMI_390]